MPQWVCAQRVLCILLSCTLYAVKWTAVESRRRATLLYTTRCSGMTFRSAAALLIAAVAVRSAIAQTATFPVLDITKGAPLPTLQQLQPVNHWITLNMLPATIQVLQVYLQAGSEDASLLSNAIGHTGSW